MRVHEILFYHLGVAPSSIAGEVHIRLENDLPPLSRLMI